MPDQSPLPFATSLDEVYTPAALAHEGERWNNLFDSFQNEFGVDSKHLKVARAPGRVNIIGARLSLVVVFPRSADPPTLPLRPGGKPSLLKR